MKRAVFVISMALLFLASCKSVERGTVQQKTYYDMNERYSLSVEQFSKFRSLSLRGDGDASFKIAQDFIYGGDAGEGYFWLRLSAEQGNCDALDVFKHMDDLSNPAAARLARKALSECSGK
ncbi:MAG TPA: hypothetical protein VKM35_04805 [Arenimonas sp.]|uniref:hypothetical protein n=1 Tax=Arenimonas sp. TaxID=1872635 RepID=UPI002BF93395|nr:hypothetical protein [Arenimonas sp.]HMB56509.1 hypothetical protein [Arenimonas sp.]